MVVGVLEDGRCERTAIDSLDIDDVQGDREYQDVIGTSINCDIAHGVLLWYN